MTFLCIMLVIMTLGIGSRFFSKDDNPVEEQSEEIIEDTIEEAIGLPKDSLHIDFTPSSREV